MKDNNNFYIDYYRYVLYLKEQEFGISIKNLEPFSKTAFVYCFRNGFQPYLIEALQGWGIISFTKQIVLMKKLLTKIKQKGIKYIPKFIIPIRSRVIKEIAKLISELKKRQKLANQKYVTKTKLYETGLGEYFYKQIKRGTHYQH